MLTVVTSKSKLISLWHNSRFRRQLSTSQAFKKRQNNNKITSQKVNVTIWIKSGNKTLIGSVYTF